MALEKDVNAWTAFWSDIFILSNDAAISGGMMIFGCRFLGADGMANVILLDKLSDPLSVLLDS